MNCRDCQDWLQRKLDGEEAQTPQLAEHLAQCPACRRLHTAADDLERGLRLLPMPAVPVNLTRTIVGRVRTERRQGQQRRRRLATSFALAATVLFTMLVTELWPRTSEVPPPASSEAIAKKQPETPSLRDTMARAGSAVTALTVRKADETVDQTKVLLPVVKPMDLPTLDLSQPLEPPARSLREAGQGMTAGFQPVSRSFGRAVNLFLREVPPMGREPKSGL